MPLVIGLKFNSQKVLSSILGLGVLTLINIGISTPAFARYCNQSVAESPSRNTRIYKDSRYGFKIEIPANYRVMQLPGGGQYSIGIFDPNGYREMACILRNKVGTENVPSYISVSVENTNSFYQNQRQSLSNGDITRPLEKNGRLIYQSGMEEQPTLHISQGYRNRLVVTFSAPIGTNNSIVMDSVLKQALNSFQ